MELMYVPSWRRGGSELEHAISQDECSQYIPYSRHQIRLEASGIVFFDEALQSPMANGTNDHLSALYGKTVRIVRDFFRMFYDVPCLEYGKRPIY